MRIQTGLVLTSIVVGVLLIAGCSGGTLSSPPAPVTTPPASANLSTPANSSKSDADTESKSAGTPAILQQISKPFEEQRERPQPQPSFAASDPLLTTLLAWLICASLLALSFWLMHELRKEPTEEAVTELFADSLFLDKELPAAPPSENRPSWCD